MIKKSRQLIGLGSFSVNVDYIDSTENAEYTFQVYDFPDRFYLGKNSFKILANIEFLANNAPILIDIEDKAGNPIYYEITNLINKDRSRTIVVHIYDDVPIGNATIFIGSRLKKNPITNEFIEQDNDGINVIWKKEILVSTSKTAAEPLIFSNPPTVFFREKLVQKRIFDGTGSRFTALQNRGSSRVSVTSRITDYNLTETREFKDIDLAATQMDVIPTFVGDGNMGRLDSPVRVPTGDKGSILKTSLFPLISSMVGGIITIRNINLSSSAPANIANSLAPVDYSASIIRVINANTAELYPPFNYSTTYSSDGILRILSFNSFDREQNFTASWMRPLNSTPSITQSFLELELRNMDPTVGNVKSIGIRYKEVGGYGTYFDLGKYQISNQNIFIDSSSVSFTEKGLTEKRMGFLEPGDNANLYWINTGSNVTSVWLTQSDRAIQDSLFISHSGIPNSASYVQVKSREKFSVIPVKGSDYSLSFLAAPRTTGSYTTPQIDIYLSGSKILNSNVKNIRNRVENSQDEFGTYLGTLRMQSGSFKEFKSEFTTVDAGILAPSFVIRDGQWEIGQIKIETTIAEGYSPNQAKLFIPLPVLSAGQELLFELEYLNEKDEPSDLVQKFSGLYFQGSDPDNIQDIGDILGPEADYRNSRLILGNPGELQLSYSSSIGESSTIQFITQSSFTSVGPGSTDVMFPVFTDIDDTVYSGSSHLVGLNFQIETVIFGKTGSFSAIQDSNTWSSTVQGRAIVTNFDNSGAPLVYRTIVVSGSTERIMGTFGPGPNSPKTNLDSWYSVQTTFVSNNELGVRHAVSPTSSFAWDFYLTSTCRVNKFAYKI